MTTRGIRVKVKSDHNPLFCSFNLSYEKQVQHSSRREVFNFKDEEAQEAFKVETDDTNKFTEVFENDESFEKQSQKFNRCLNQSVQKCFTKFRIRNTEKETEVDRLLKMKSKLDIFLQSCKCEKSIKQVKVKIDNIEKKIQELSSLRNAKIVENFVQNLKCNGKFSQTGMWKLRKRLHPSKNLDPPIAKMDTKGNLITSPNLIKKLYVDTYVDRLRHREIKPELVDLYHMKNDLWKRRQEILRLKKSPDWTIDDLNKVLKALKNNKSRDPHGFINDIFKPGVIGNNLRNGILYLVNGIKENFFFPAFMQWANVTTIYKSRGSRLCLDSDRGIFVISILKRLIDRMIYNDKYDHIESNMSHSNIGGRRNMNMKET